MGIKIKDVLKVVRVGTEIGKVFVPGGVGKVLDVVNHSIGNPNDPANEDALKALAAVNDQQTADIQELTQAILALHERVKKLEAK